MQEEQQERRLDHYDKKFDHIYGELDGVKSKIGEIAGGLGQALSSIEHLGTVLERVERNQTRVEEKQASAGKWNFGVVFSGMSVVIGIAALCGALVMLQINASASASEVADKRHNEYMKVNREMLAMLHQRREDEAFERGKLTQKMDDTKERYLWLKDMLIKHLDDGHPDSVISLFTAKHEEQEKLIRELERIQDLMSRDRFTGKEGDRMQRQLDSILEEQRDRTRYIPKEVQ